MAEKNLQPDENIIELTDLIEAGASVKAQVEAARRQDNDNIVLQEEQAENGAAGVEVHDSARENESVDLQAAEAGGNTDLQDRSAEAGPEPGASEVKQETAQISSDNILKSDDEQPEQVAEATDNEAQQAKSEAVATSARDGQEEKEVSLQAAIPAHEDMDMAVHNQAEQAHVIADICRSMLDEHIEETRRELREFSGQLGVQTAHVEDMAGSINDLCKRLFACEARLDACSEKIAAIEKNLAASSGIADLLKNGTDMHSGFMAIVASAVANALNGVMDKLAAADGLRAEVASLTARLQQNDAQICDLEKQLKQFREQLADGAACLESEKAAADEKYVSKAEMLEVVRNNSAVEACGEMIAVLTSRLDNLEKKLAQTDAVTCANETALEKYSGLGDTVLARVADLEKKINEPGGEYNASLERAAAAAAARVLHEEIKKLAEG